MTVGRRIALLTTLAAAVAAALYAGPDAATIDRLVADAGLWGPLLFLVIYAIATVLFVPGAALTLAGGALFGPLAGAAICLTGATLGATAAFLLSRHLAADWVAARAGPRLRQLQDGVAAEGWRFVALVRLMPLLPFNLLNYALGLTRIGLRPYVIASAVCMAPGALAYTWLGHAGRSALAGSDDLIRNALVALALLALTLFLPRLLRRLRAAPATLDVPALAEALAGTEAPLLIDLRDAADYAGGHIAGAISVPLPVLPARLDELAAWKTRPLALICRTDRRSTQAQALLAAAGFTDVRVVRAGMARWCAEQRPLTRAAAT